MVQLSDLVPGGAHTYSKGNDQFSSNVPELIVYGSGSHIFDDTGKEYIDCAMGLTSVSVGHGNAEIVDAVYKTISKGTNFSRPALLELEAAQYFLDEVAHAHDMVKFTKNGSSATTAAVKLARAYTNKEEVLIPKGFPFFSYDDWFITSNELQTRYSGLHKEFNKAL